MEDWKQKLVDFFDGNDGTIFPVWLMCYNGELDDEIFDCGCCLNPDCNRHDPDYSREGFRCKCSCGCICHERFERLINYIEANFTPKENI